MASRRRYPSKQRNSQSGAQDKVAASATRSKPQKPKGKQVRSNGSAHPKNSFDRYTALARAAAAAGDVVGAENYYQHAEHYYRLMNQKAA